jgi:methionyl-tRNA formyltransferase
MRKNEVNIVFMGTPDFAVPSLDALLGSGYNIVGVVTAPDREAGRGRKIKYSAVKEFALDHNLNLLQPEKLKNENFLSELKSLNADVYVVVAFRMLPEQVWKMPPLGSFNLHASLLPQYRGAAPINHALINGEKSTGLTTFFLDDKIDTGRIIKQIKVEIKDDEDFGQLHDRMKILGASLVLDTVELIREGNLNLFEQGQFIETGQELKPAPKIFKSDCKIDWSKSASEINNLIRGLSPMPAAYSKLYSGGNEYQVKFLKSNVDTKIQENKQGQILCDQKTYLKVACKDAFINVRELQIEGKRKMKTEEFLRGFKIPPSAFFE